MQGQVAAGSSPQSQTLNVSESKAQNVADDSKKSSLENTFAERKKQDSQLSAGHNSGITSHTANFNIRGGADEDKTPSS